MTRSHEVSIKNWRSTIYICTKIIYIYHFFNELRQRSPNRVRDKGSDEAKPGIETDTRLDPKRVQDSEGAAEADIGVDVQRSERQRGRKSH